MFSMGNSQFILGSVGILILLVGVLGGYVLIPAEVVTKEVIKEVTVEVPIEVAGVCTVVEEPNLLDIAVNDFLDEVEDEDDLQRCSGNIYDFDEISISRLYDEYSINFNEDDYSVDFEIRLKYDEDDVRSCKETYNVNVFYEEDEDPEVNILT